MQTLATLLANKTQHCWAQHVASVCTPCCVLLRLVGSCWMKFDQFQTSSNKSQQHATTHHMVCKRSQHVGPNNVASVCMGLYSRVDDVSTCIGHKF